MKANLHHRGHRGTQGKGKRRRRRRAAAHTARCRPFDAVVRKQIYFATSSVFSAPFFTSFFTALAPFFTSLPVSVAAVFVASAVLSAVSSVASPVFTAAFLVACAVFLAATAVVSPKPARFFWELRTHPYASGVSFSSSVRVSSSTSHFFRMVKMVLDPNPARIRLRKMRADCFRSLSLGFCRRLRRRQSRA